MESSISKNQEDVLKLRFAALPDDGVLYVTMYGLDISKDDVLPITKKGLDLSKDWNSFIFIWGMPGPDYNRYYFKDYGRTWVFDLEDFCEPYHLYERKRK